MRPDGKRGDGLFASLRSLRAVNGDRRDVIAKVFHGTFDRMPEGRAGGRRGEAEHQCCWRTRYTLVLRFYWPLRRHWGEWQEFRKF